MRLPSLILVSLLNACASPPGNEPAVAPMETSAPAAGPEASTTPETTVTAVPTAAPEASAPLVVEKYALVVSFFSPGNGTDREAYDKLMALVQKQPKHLAVVTGRWGKEGEHDECFQLNELPAEEKTAFVAAVKKEMASSKRVKIGEDAPCNAR
jgi:hypothetical protein